MKLILTLIAFCVSFFLKAQSLEDVVYLKSGKVVRGTIVEQSQSSVTIKILGKYSFVYSQEEIEKIVKEPSQSNNTTPNSISQTTSNLKSTSETKPANIQTTGYVGYAEVGFIAALGDYGLSQFKVNVINGYKFNPNFSLGLGVGYRKIFDSNFEKELDFFPYTDNYIPIFINVKSKFGSGNITPVANLDFGYSFTSADGFEGIGMLINPAFGILIGKGKTKASITLGLDIQKMDVLVFDPNDFFDIEKKGIAGLSLNIGVTF